MADVGGWSSFLKAELDWEPKEKTVFIFDEAQMSYKDGGLWNEFSKTYTATINVAPLPL